MQINSAPALSPLNQKLVNTYKNNKPTSAQAETIINSPKAQEFKNGFKDKIEKLPQNKKLLTSLAIIGALIAGVFLYYRAKAKNPDVAAKNILNKALGVKNNANSVLNETQKMKKSVLESYNEVMAIINNASKTNFANFETKKGVQVRFIQAEHIPNVMCEIDENGKLLRKTIFLKAKDNNFFIKNIFDYRTKTRNKYVFSQDGSINQILIDYKKINKNNEKFAKGIGFKDNATIFCESAEIKNNKISKAKTLYSFTDDKLNSFFEDIDTQKGKKSCFNFQDEKIQSCTIKDDKSTTSYTFIENDGKYKICANYNFDLIG